MGNRAGNEQRQAPAHFALFWLGKPTSSTPSLALVQRCGIFQENFKIITERGRQLETDLKEEEEKKRAGWVPQVSPEYRALGM